MSLWRLIEDSPLEGSSNMAFDEAVFFASRLSLESGADSLPLLRLYSWKNSEVSLGYNQNCKSFSDLKLNRVRRITGGKAVLHMPESFELTYSVVCPSSSDIFKLGIKESYCLISKVFILALSKIGIRGELKTNSFDENPEACFVSTGLEEVSVNGKKIIGSAQRRRSWGFLQQGSVIFKKDAVLTESVFGKGVSDTFTSIEEFCEPNIDKFKKALKESFKEVLKCNFTESCYSETELELANYLRDFKYNQDSWTLNKKFKDNSRNIKSLSRV